MEIRNSYLLVGFILMFGLLCYSLTHINNFMVSYDTCKDDFAIIDKCKCLPQEYPNLFPEQVTKYSNFTTDG